MTSTTRPQIKRTKTGAFVHLTYERSNQAFCGVRAPIIVRGTVNHLRCCVKCFGTTPANFNEHLAPGSRVD